MLDARKLNEAKVRALAVEADVDPRTIRRAYRGEAVRGMSGERARRVLVRAGLLDPLGPAEQTRVAS
jgi:hypothetical protein